jgi:small redox-active disulfide protein 2
MLIEIFGTGCAKCQTLEKNAKQAAERSGGDHAVVKVSEYAAIAARGILSTPALAIDGQLKFQGKVASSAEILELLKA